MNAAMVDLPLVRGHVIGDGSGWAIVFGGAACRPVELAPPGEDPLVLAPLRARRWPIGDLLLWDGLDWEGEAEELARRALEDGRGMDDVKGASAALRAAFAFATARVASRALGIPASPAELSRWVRDIVSTGRTAAEVALRVLARERAEFAERHAVRAPIVRTAAPPRVDLEARIEAALRNTGARSLGWRRTSDSLIEVRWLYAGQRLVSLVDEGSLRVIDSGVCLAGADELATLESLPGVVEEAMRDEALVITRRAD